MGGEATDNFVHVDNAVSSDVVNANIEDMSTFAHLVFGHLYASVPVALEHGFAELAGSVGVSAFTNKQDGVVLAKRNMGVNRGGTGFEVGLARCGCSAIANAVDDGF